MVLNAADIRHGWQTEEMPMGRVMSDGILTPDGKVMIVNGAGSGIAGCEYFSLLSSSADNLTFSSSPDGNVRDEIGASNARDPVLQPLLYDPDGKAGRRISKNAPLQKYERLYHSSATLIPDGRIWISGSNP